MECSIDDLYLEEDIKLNIIKYSLSDYPVLITGESGVGKDYVANLIHYLSSRSSKNIVNIELSSIPSDLMEKELFGAVSGAYTGLEEDYIGKFQQANDGTVILNGLGDVDYLVQGKLLKVIESGIFYPVGSNLEYRTNIRVLTLLSSSYDEICNSESIRKDLLFRVNTLLLDIPPLNLRSKFISKIVLDTLNKLDKHGEVSIDSESLIKLKDFNWKGNVRELINCIERAYILREGSKIYLDSLLLSSDNTVNITSKKLKDAVNEFKAQYIAKALDRCNGNVTKCAIELGIQRTYLSRLIKELKIY